MGSKTIAFLGLFLAIVLLITSELKLLNRPMGLMMPSIMVDVVDMEVGMDTVDMEAVGMEVAEVDMEAVGMEVAEVDMGAADTEVAEEDTEVAEEDTEVAVEDMEAAVTKKGINVIGANI
ncbi:hypothetical protein RHMOL_Rhmol06G0239200 [Rhododendron molle]|uniref:Uncharacterized protein n=1 Tax=Rhododendron molle TaxID=49168 RepID=A0ACC0NFH3_RHOML|nr:hypothetical protein RHMOL_Rhmol06G0239200 [Rhododendron molle]